MDILLGSEHSTCQSHLFFFLGSMYETCVNLFDQQMGMHACTIFVRLFSTNNSNWNAYAEIAMPIKTKWYECSTTLAGVSIATRLPLSRNIDLFILPCGHRMWVPTPRTITYELQIVQKCSRVNIGLVSDTDTHLIWSDTYWIWKK